MTEQSNLWNQYMAVSIFFFTIYTFMRDYANETMRANAILAIGYSVLFTLAAIAIIIILDKFKLSKRPNELK